MEKLLLGAPEWVSSLVRSAAEPWLAIILAAVLVAFGARALTAIAGCLASVGAALLLGSVVAEPDRFTARVFLGGVAVLFALGAIQFRMLARRNALLRTDVADLKQQVATLAHQGQKAYLQALRQRESETDEADR